MLKVYDVRSMCRINHEPWAGCGPSGYVCIDESEAVEEKILMERCSFSTAHRTLEAHPLDGVYAGRTAFRKRPYIEVSGWRIENCGRFFSRQAHTFSYKLVYKELQRPTLQWIMDHLSAEQAIQYLKERGMNVCPVIST